MMDKDKIINKLNHLLARTYDAEKGYVEAANHLSSNYLNKWLQENAFQRYRFGHEIKSEIKRLGGTPEKGTSLLGEAHQFWMNFKSYFTSNDEAGMLEEAIRGEEAASEDYKEVLENTVLPLETKIVLQDQHSIIQANIRSMKRMLRLYEITVA